MHAAGESNETKWFKECRKTKNGYLYESIEDLDRHTHLINYGVINRAVNGKLYSISGTCSRADFAGGKNDSIVLSPALRTGSFEKQCAVCKFNDTAAAGDCAVFGLESGELAHCDYVISAHFTKEEALSETHTISPSFAEEQFALRERIWAEKRNDADRLKISFDGGDGNFGGEALSRFTENVIRQVDFCAKAKNSGVSMLGVRDMIQQTEAAIFWDPISCRGRILEMLNFIDPSGRAPRQYSIPAPDALPRMDTREFIDQGLWIISTLYTYLSYTGDYSILDEECGYYRIIGDNCVESVTERNSVAEHIRRIADFLIDNLDEKTDCLHALYGDWNDALDGLGISRDPNEPFGTGVSVMASLQLYKNLRELAEISKKYGKELSDTQKYEGARERLKRGLTRYAVEEKDGKRKILHGWGDGYSYKVGSFCDSDGESRDGLTANAWWVISDAYLWDKSIKRDILESYSRLDSKYGLKTFEPYFASDAKGVGRIVNLPKGTAENAAVYAHSAMFGIWSLFAFGESRLGWQQLEKVLPITHKKITTTPFIMSNSYCYNEELGLDGESMSDWFTGSANAYIKALVWYVFGIQAKLDGIWIRPAAYIPFRKSNMEITVRGKRITLVHTVDGRTTRKITLNGTERNTLNDPSSEVQSIFIPYNELADKNLITIQD